MGVLRNDEHRVPLGLEIAGVIRQVGADVQGLSIGDRVLAIPPSACASTAIVMPASLVQKIPDSLTFEGAATMPICFSTVIESLVNLGSLEKGQVGAANAKYWMILTNSQPKCTVCPNSLCHGRRRSCRYSDLSNDRSRGTI